MIGLSLAELYLDFGVRVGHHGDEHIDQCEDSNDVEDDEDKMTDGRREIVTIVHLARHVAFLQDKHN